jgi:hypothetical protein
MHTNQAKINKANRAKVSINPWIEAETFLRDSPQGTSEFVHVITGREGWPWPSR